MFQYCSIVIYCECMCFSIVLLLFIVKCIIVLLFCIIMFSFLAIIMIDLLSITTFICNVTMGTQRG